MNDRCEFIDDATEDDNDCPNEAEVLVEAVNTLKPYRARSCLRHLGMMLTDNEQHLVTRIERKTTARDA